MCVVIDEDHPGRRVPGGYAAWEAARRSRRGSGRATATIATGPRSTGGARPTRAAAGPSPSTLKRRLKDAEQELRELEKRKARLVADLEAAGGDVELLAGVGTEIAAVDAALADAEHRWLELAQQLDG